MALRTEFSIAPADAATVAPSAPGQFLAGFSTETTPRQAARIVDFSAHFPIGTRVNVTHLVGSEFADTVRTAARLKSEGFVPVPHLSARLIASERQFDEMLRRLRGEAEIDEVLVVAGGCKLPLGPFASSLQLLETGLFDKYGIHRIGVAGHPEGSPDIAPDVALDALLWKNAFAERSDADIYVVTQFCFDIEAVIRWERVIRQAGSRLPIHIGLAGPATLRTLLSYATTCGIGPSMRVLSRQARNLRALATEATPDRMLVELANYKAAEPESLIQAVHVFPLGGVARTAAWTRSILGAEAAVVVPIKNDLEDRQ